ncbi:MAG TPA: protein kinase [Vicinamibacterales bacterium]|nr:protein kinase [Vicinamibacterales bacterium]
MIGRTLAHYEIVSALGRGGMGEVFRARDTKLGREVAIKTLPDEYARDPDRLSRFDREARFLATLDHPNIAGIHGLEESGGTRFLVLELVEGETLRDRLYGPDRPTVREALGLAFQIAQALEAAHAKGVVHRDLKPSNIKVTASGQVKVLDFGLAKALDIPGSGSTGDANLSLSPTISASATRHGVLLGTADYMSPEQARGEAVDLRADIWAFGCVLYEMLAGQKPFEGRTVSDILAAVLKSEPDWSRLPADLRPRVRYLLERCLRKEARERPARVAEVRHEIEKALADKDGAQSGPAMARVRPRSRLVAAAAVVLTGVVALAAGTVLLDSSEPLPLMRFGFPAGPLRSLPEIPVVAFAPDGARLAYTTLDGLLVRGLDEAEPVAVPGPTGWIGTPAFSSDGLSLAYVNAPTEKGPFSIMRVPIGGGTPATIHIGIPSLPTDLDWDARDVLMYAQPDGIWEVSAAGGGDARLVIAAADGEALASPQLLPGGSGILFVSTKATGPDRWSKATIFVASPGSEPADRQIVREGGSDARYVPSGHLIFADGTTLWAAPFSPGSGLTGERFRVVDQVFRASSGVSDTAQYAVSASGALVHLGIGADDPAASAAGGGVTLGAPQGLSLVWVDRMGKEEPIDVRPDRYSSVRLSPDGNRVAVVIGGNPIAGEPRDVWIVDLRTEDISRLTTDGQSDAPIWLDNNRILYRATPIPVGVFSVPVDGGEPRLLRRSPTAPTAYPMGLTPDGRTLLVLHAPSVQQQNLLTLPMNGAGDYVRLLDEPGVQSFASVSPNGRFMVYHQGPNFGDTSVMVRPFPEVALRSYTVGPGGYPVFSRDGSEIFYFDGQSIAAVPVKYDPFDIGAPASLGLRGPYFYGANRTWDEGPDGRFLITRMGTPSLPQGSIEIQVVVGFSRVLEGRTQ